MYTDHPNEPVTKKFYYLMHKANAFTDTWHLNHVLSSALVTTWSGYSFRAVVSLLLLFCWWDSNRWRTVYFAQLLGKKRRIGLNSKSGQPGKKGKWFWKLYSVQFGSKIYKSLIHKSKITYTGQTLTDIVTHLLYILTSQQVLHILFEWQPEFWSSTWMLNAE